MAYLYASMREKGTISSCIINSECYETALYVTPNSETTETKQHKTHFRKYLHRVARASKYCAHHGPCGTSSLQHFI